MNRSVEGAPRGAKLKNGPPRWIFFWIFTLSGFSGLIYESIWSHYLKLFLGHAAYAQSLVLMIFMGGLALGSWLSARYSERVQLPILAYALVEGVIGIIALLFHGVFIELSDTFYFTLLPSLDSPWLAGALKWSASAALIVPQSVLLGMTFPLMTTGVIRRYPEGRGASLSMLYFTNSIGAAIGVLASGFWLIGAIGLPGAIMTAGLLNIALALVVFVLVRLDPVPPAQPARGRSDAASAAPDGLAMLFFVAAGITGAASFIYEIGWIRMLSLVLGATTHSFELMLSAFITGLAFGGLWIKRRIDGIRNPVAFAGWVQVIMGAMAILTVPLYVQTFDWMAVLLQGLDRSTAGYGLFTAASHAIALAVMVPTTFLAGMTLPLFTHVLMRGRHGEQAIGRVYAANTLGAIVGVLFAVHVGMPLLGLKNLIGLGAGLDIALGVALLYRSQERSANALALRGALAGAGMLAFIMATVDLDPKRLASGVYRYSVAQWGENVRVAYYKDGKTASVSLAAYGSEIALATNGKPDAFVQLDPELPRTVDEITMVMAGVLPLAYNPAARQVANVGLGSGLTTHTLLAHEGIELVDTVEIEAAMIEAAELGFGTRVGRAFSDPRSRIHLEDAKTFFSLHNRKYDVIVAEPSNPWVSGVASLFSEEFYRTVPNYLNEDGVLVQWLQLYEFDNGLVASVTKALAEHFRDYAIYHTDDTNILIVAKPHGMLPEPDFAKILDGPLGAEAAEVGLRNPADFLVRRTASARIINHWLAQSPIPANSDYFPYLDLNAGKARFLGEVVTVFLTWSVTPLPLLEMLDGSRVAVDDVSPTDRFRRTGLINNARSIYAAFTSDEDSAAHRLTPLAPALTTLHLLRRSCELPGFEESWVLGLHTLAESSLAFLDAHDATELLRAALPDRCREHRSQRLLAWYGLYQRIAARDAHGMGVAAEEVLKLDHVASAERRSYALAAAMLGRLCSGHPDRALALWDERVELVGDIEGMLDFQLIVAVAMSRQNGAGR